VFERFRSLTIFFIHEGVCHRWMRNRLRIALPRGEEKFNTSLVARATA
jgi:hypothetical protein